MFLNCRTIETQDQVMRNTLAPGFPIKANLELCVRIKKILKRTETVMLLLSYMFIYLGQSIR